MAYAPNPRFTKEDSNPIVIQNKMPKQEAADVTGNIPGMGGGNSTFRIVGNTNPSTAATSPTTSSTNPYPAGYTSGMPNGLDTVSGPGASYQATNGQNPGNGNNNQPPGSGDKSSGGPRADWVNPNLTGGSPRGSVNWGKYYTAPANNPGTYDPNDIGRGIGWGQPGGWNPNTPSPGTTGTNPGGFAPRDGGNVTVGNPAGMQTSRMATQGDQARYHTQGTPPPPGTTANGDIRGGSTNGGGGSPYLGPPGLGGGGQQQGGGAPWTPRPDYSTQDRGPLADMLRGRVGYYHPGTGISTAGTPYANPGYGNPAGQWTPGYQAPSWLGGGYRGGTGGGNGPNPNQDPPNRGGNVFGGGGSYLRDIRNMDSGSGPTGPPGGTQSSGGGGGGGWVTVGMAPGMDSSRIASNDPRFAGRTGVPAFYPNSLQEIPQRGYRVGSQEQARGYTTGIPSGNDTISGPGAGSPYLGPPQGGPPPGGGIPPYPTIDWSNPPSPQELLQMVNDWWKAFQAANPGGGPGPRFPGMVPTGATGVSSPYAPGAWQRMQEIWPPGRGTWDPNTSPTGGGARPPGGGPPPWDPNYPKGDPGDAPPTRDPFYFPGWDYLKSQRPGSGPRR